MHQIICEIRTEKGFFCQRTTDFPLSKHEVGLGTQKGVTVHDLVSTPQYWRRCIIACPVLKRPVLWTTVKIDSQTVYPGPSIQIVSSWVHCYRLHRPERMLQLCLEIPAWNNSDLNHQHSKYHRHSWQALQHPLTIFNFGASVWT